MKGKNNLGYGSFNTYWKVTKSFEVHARVGIMKGSGASPEPVFRKVKAKKGEFIHDLHGGVYKVSESGVAQMIIVDKKEQLYPLSCLKQIKREDSPIPRKYLNDEFHYSFSEEELKNLDLKKMTPT